jgi:hypothetical protein
LDPASSEVKLLRRLARYPQGRNPLADSGLGPVWKAGDRMLGFIGPCFYTVPELGAGEAQYRTWPSPTTPVDSYRSLPDGMAVIAGRRFVPCRDFLREIDDDGKILRTWPKMPAANDYRRVAHDSSHIFFMDGPILCLDPVSETLYGPLETEPWAGDPGGVVSGPHGVWFSYHRSLIYLDGADFIAAAKKAGKATGWAAEKARGQAEAAK